MASEACNKANEEYVNENYQKAVDLYSEALTLDSKRDDIYCHRAQAYLQLGDTKNAVADCDKAIELNENNSKAYLKKGSALYQMNDISSALDVFKKGHKRFEDDKHFDDWVNKCEKEQKKDGTTPAQPTAASAPAATIPQVAKVRYDWYQTHTHVIVTVLLKNVKKEDLDVDTKTRKLTVSVKNPELTLSLDLLHEISPDQTQIKLFASKIEVKLKKQEGIQWSKLEGDPQESAPTVCPSSAAPDTEQAPQYPSSSLHTRDWDKLAAEVKEEEKNEKLEGDAALNQFFQKIYSDASDETKKAMMKSFTESGGTVLSTNWDEVGSKKVEVKPPDGMEYKKWEN